MAKGRKSNPSKENEGKWYPHKNCGEFLHTQPRKQGTTTGSMLDLQNAAKLTKPQCPPQHFTHTERDNYMVENPFSLHDNRHNIQLTGEYLDDGGEGRKLGRRITQDHNRLHSTEKEFLRHNGRQVTESFYSTNYMLSHTAPHSAPASFRRFPKAHTPSEESAWSVNYVSHNFAPSKTSSQCLVSSIEPHVKRNSWKYSYHGSHDVYPKVWGDRCAVRANQQNSSPCKPVLERIPRQCHDIKLSD